MKSNPTLPRLALLGVLLVLGGTGVFTAVRGEAPEEAGAREDGGEGENPVLLELFTSQGCSSCPPADRLLSRLSTEPGSGVIALAFHVDYWNYIGWTDPFSSDAWSDRQRRYGAALDQSSVYTPELVINGRHHVVGSREDQVEDAVEEARRRAPGARIDLAVEPGEGGDSVALQISARSLASSERPLDILLAVAESGLVTPVGAGENRSKTLRNDCVVRRLETVAKLSSGRGAEIRERLNVALDPEWEWDKVRLVVFAQDSRTMAVHAVAAVGL